MLAGLLIVASFVAGLVKAPWWFWLVGGITLALLHTTDPKRLRASYAEQRGLGSLPLVADDLWTVTRSCVIAAAAFGGGTVLASRVLVW